MSSASNYIHGSSDAHEVERLERQARYIAPRTLTGFAAVPGEWVLDLGTGVGAMAQQLLDRFPSIHVIGVDLRESQLSHARTNHPGARYVQADATRLPFPDACFDRVHASWLLEHIPAPERVVSEMLRVLRPGGLCQVLEVDNRTFQMNPPDPALQALLDEVDEAQLAAGGDPFIGPKVESMFRSAGFAGLENEPLVLGGGNDRPEEVVALGDEMAGTLQSADESVSPERAAAFRAGAERFRALARTPGTAMRYVATLLRAKR